jgi:hypothetical protein
VSEEGKPVRDAYEERVLVLLLLRRYKHAWSLDGDMFMDVMRQSVICKCRATASGASWTDLDTCRPSAAVCRSTNSAPGSQLAEHHVLHGEWTMVRDIE